MQNKTYICLVSFPNAEWVRPVSYEVDARTANEAAKRARAYADDDGHTARRLGPKRVSVRRKAES